VTAFHRYITQTYRPPPDKRFLVFFQCSVRRPFSTSPSHGSMRRAISVATGYDPARDFRSCPVHVVVLASTVGPVPYELEDTYPANVRAGGVKDYRRETYEAVKPILAGRMADYLTVHGACYDRISTFTHSAYADVMREALRLAGARFPILPTADGPRVRRMGKSTPRTYWQKGWIQLYLEILTWLSPAGQRQAAERLAALDVEYD
jgi:predicted RNA-binding protein